MKDFFNKFPLAKSILAFLIGVIATYLGITIELPVNYTGVTPKVDSVKVITDSVKVDTTNAE